MKIVGHTTGGYLVEMHEDEIAAAMGFATTYGDYRDATAVLRVSPRSGYGSADGQPLAIGSELKPVTTHAALRNVLTQEGKIREAAATLRALAGLMDKGLPSAFIPPPEPEAPVAPAETGAGLE